MIQKKLRILLLLIGVCSFAQELPKILPPSPNAAALGKYGQVPVGLFTGTPQVNIPLYTFNSGSLSIPLALNYSSNGIRVDELPSNVGLGWSLQAGGVITRVIMDDADETKTVPIPENFPGSYTQEALDYINNAMRSEDGYDTLSDMYSFNVNGFSGKFYLNEDRTPVLINPSPVLIEKGINGYAFKITDPNGVMYWFGNQNSTETSRYQQVGSGQHGWSLDNSNSWYLSKMKNHLGDEINFLYTKFDQHYYSAVSQSVSAVPSSASVGVAGQGLVQTRTMTSISQLSSITSTFGQIHFTYSANTIEFNKLDRIEIKNTNGVLIKKFDLEYNSVISSMPYLKNQNIPYIDAYSKRLFLSKVTEFGSDGTKEKPYLLSYYNPDKIPPRFSYAQDYWGYYNGQHYNKYFVSSEDYFFYRESNARLLQNIFSAVGGNKQASGAHSLNGMLKSITFPTGGFNELLYEPHSYEGTRTVYPPKIHKTLNIQNDTDSFDGVDVFTTEAIPFTQNDVSIGFTTQRGSCWEPNWADHHVRAVLNVKIADQGSNLFFSPSGTKTFFSLDQRGNKIYHTGGLVATEDTARMYFIDLEEGKRYRFTLDVVFECVNGDFNIGYYDSGEPSVVQENKEVGGQRLQKVITNDGRGKEEIKSYHYGDLSCMDCSSGVAEKPIPAISYTRHFGTSAGQLIQSNRVVDMLTLSSSTLRNIYSKAGHQIGYTSVIEEFGTNFSGGGIAHKFRITPNTSPPPFGLTVAGTPYDTNFGTGEEIETQIFKKSGSSFTVLQKTTNTYYNNPVLNQKQAAYTIRLRDVYSGIDPQNIVKSINSFDIAKYNIKSEWRYLSKKVSEEYNQNGENPITTTTNYFYDNPKHLQATRTEVKINNGDKVISKTYYPEDVILSTSLGNDKITTTEFNAIRLLQSPSVTNPNGQHRIAEPIQVENIVEKPDGTVLSRNTQRTLYKNWGNNLILPEFVKTLKGEQSDSNLLKNRMQYRKYDTTTGNPIEVSQVSGPPITYIWGYQKQFPIAKIENVGYNQIETSVADLQTKSNADNDHCRTATCKEQILRDALENLRETLPDDAMMTSYTYDPLIGVTSITDPKGDTSYFEYDPFSRLMHTRDDDDNITNKYYYHYAGVPHPPLTADITTKTWEYTNTGIALQAIAGGGSKDYSYSWEITKPGNVTVLSTGKDITIQSGATAGMVTIILTITDNYSGKTKKANKAISIYPPLTVANNSISLPAEHEVKKVATFTINPTNGSGNYTYNWKVYNANRTYRSTKKSFSLTMGYEYYGQVRVECTVHDSLTGDSKVASTIMNIKELHPWTVSVASMPPVSSPPRTQKFQVVANIGGGSGSYTYRWYVNDSRVSTSSSTYVTLYCGTTSSSAKVRCEVTDRVTGRIVSSSKNQEYTISSARCRNTGGGGSGGGNPRDDSDNSEQ